MVFRYRIGAFVHVTESLLGSDRNERQRREFALRERAVSPRSDARHSLLIR